jgi:surfactin synthase thioesterase subunit
MSAKQLVNLNKVQDYHSILICFHWVGGNGFSYRKLAMTLAAHGILVYGYALVENSLNPANKKQQTRPKSVQEAATNFIQCLEQQMNAHPSDGISLFNPLNKAIHLFGHSYGGMIAYEAMRMLHQTKQQACHLNKIEKLIVSCVRSPTDLSRYNQSRVNPNYLLSDAALVKEIVRIGGESLS